MSKSNKLSLHIFRRDLRLQDNTALIEALRTSEQVIPCFIFDKRQIEVNDFKGDHSLAFMANSLKELDTDLHGKNSMLYFFYGEAETIVDKLLSEMPIDAVFFNRDYTPFSKSRDASIADVCQNHRVNLNVYADALLHEPEDILKKDGTPYTIFTPFLKKAQEIRVDSPTKNNYDNYYQKKITLVNHDILPKLLKKKTTTMLLQGGRKEGLALLKHAATLKNYQTIRNIPSENGTTKLSAHNKFGTVSIREAYQLIANALGKKAILINELFWRDFFTHITFHFPQVLGEAFHSKYNQLHWSNNEKSYRAWCNGMTGFPIVDAGMRELNMTGYMHNRVRMIVASFLTKDLHVDWRWGEKYFAQKLLDYDPAVNNGNWQWAASTGCDAQPYFRIFNPWLQQQKFDPDCLYIKRWIPELASIPNKTIHHLYENPRLMTNYPDPIVTHSIESAKAKELYKSL